MGPFDWLKNKLSQGLNDVGNAVSTGVHDVGHAISTGVGDVEHAIGINNGPSPAQTGGLNISQPAVHNINLTNINNQASNFNQPTQVKPLNTAAPSGTSGAPLNLSNQGPNIRPYSTTLKQPNNGGMQGGQSSGQLSQAAQNKGMYGQSVVNIAKLNPNAQTGQPLKLTNKPQTFTQGLKQLGSEAYNNLLPAQYLNTLRAAGSAVNANIAAHTNNPVAFQHAEQSFQNDVHPGNSLLTPQYLQHPTVGGALAGAGVGALQIAPYVVGPEVAGAVSSIPAKLAISSGVGGVTNTGANIATQAQQSGKINWKQAAESAGAGIGMGAIGEGLHLIAPHTADAVKSSSSAAAQTLHNAIQSIPSPVRTVAMNAASQDKSVLSLPTNLLTPTDLSGYGELDPSQVEAYKQHIASGGSIDPILAMQGHDGNLYVEDGKHRLAALNELGIQNAPVKIVTPEDIHTIAQSASGELPESNAGYSGNGSINIAKATSGSLGEIPGQSPTGQNVLKVSPQTVAPPPQIASPIKITPTTQEALQLERSLENPQTNELGRTTQPIGKSEQTGQGSLPNDTNTIRIKQGLAERIKKNYSPSENAPPAEKRALNYILNNPDQAMHDYDQRTMSEFGSDVPNFVAGDEGKFIIPGFDSTMSAAYHEPASALAKVKYEQLLADPTTRDKPVMLMAGGTGAGKTSSLKGLMQQEGKNLSDYAAVIDTNSNKIGSATSKIESALKSGRNVEINYVYRHPVEAFENGVLPRAAKVGRIVPVDAHMDTHLGSSDVMAQLAKRYADNPNVLIRVVDNSRGKGQQAYSTLANLPDLSYNNDRIRGQIEERLQNEHQKGNISREEYTTYTGRSPTGRSPEYESTYTGRSPEYESTGTERLGEQARSGNDTSNGKELRQERREGQSANTEGTIDGFQTSQELVKDYADMLRQQESGLKGGQLQSDFEGGYVRTSEHGPFYRAYYAEHGKAPTKAAYLEQAEKELAAGHGAYDASDTYAKLKEREQSQPNLSVVQNADTERPPAQQQLEDAHNSGDVQSVAQIIQRMNANDPYKPTMESVFADDIKQAQEAPNKKVVQNENYTPLYDPRRGEVQRGESGQIGQQIGSTDEYTGADLHYNPRATLGGLNMSPEELASLQRTAPLLTIRDLDQAKAEDVIPHPTSAKERIEQADTDALSVLRNNGSRKSVVANYVEHYDMSKQQAEHRVSMLQREINLTRSSPNPMADKVTIPESSPGKISTAAISPRYITKNISTFLQRFNTAATKLDDHDIQLLDKLHGNDPASVIAEANDKTAFKEVSDAAKDYNDYTQAAGYKLGQPLPYRQQYGGRLLFDLKDQASRDAFMSVASPTDKGYTLPRNIKDYDQASALGIKRRNGNFVQDINEDAAERSNDLRKLAVQQALEQAYPSRVAVGEIARDAETGKLYKQLTIPGGTHLSMPADIADRLNNRLRFEAAPDLGVKEGNVKGAIARSTGMGEEVASKFKEAAFNQKHLSEEDKDLLYRVDNGEDLHDVSKDAESPSQFRKAVQLLQDAMGTYNDSLEKATGNAKLQPQSLPPRYFAAAPEQMDQMEIPAFERLKDQPGFVDTQGTYGSYEQAQESGLQPLFKSIPEAADYFSNNAANRVRTEALTSTLAHAAPNDIGSIDERATVNNERLKPAAAGNLPFTATDKLDKALTNFKSEWHPTSTVGQGIEKGVKLSGSVTKKALFLGSPFHQVHISENVAFASLLGGEPRAFADGLINEAKARGGIGMKSYYGLLDHFRNDGLDGQSSTLDYARNMGMQLPDHSGLDRFINSYALSLAEAAKRGGIEEGSQAAVDLGKVYNHLLGRQNAAVEGINPTIERMTSYFSLAPHYMRTQLSLVKEALFPKKLGGAGYDRPLSLLSPGGAARSAVLGPRILGAISAITAGAIIMHHFPTWQQAVNESGLNPNNTNPNIPIKSRNAKGETQVMNLPTDPLGLAFGFVTDPKHFFQSRESPLLSFGTKVATNTNWNGTPLVDTNKPGQFPLRILKAAENSVLPIGVQNFTNLQHNPNNPNIAQGIGQEFGLRLKTNPNDPQVKANAAYFNTLSQVTNGLKNSGPYGQYWAQQFANLHPSNTTDASGMKYPTPYEPLSSEQKYAAYVDSSSGTPQLSPVFYADQKLANATKGYPSSPLYSLSGNGTAANGQQTPKALVALEYQHAQDPAAKTNIMNANGGQSGWLASYENTVGKFAQNYQSNLTGYFQNLGWTPKAINTYWQNHPSTSDPVDAVNLDQKTTDLVSQYYQLQSSGDSTAASQFFSQNANVLGNAFDLIAQHANAIRTAKGELNLQGYPTESPQVAQILGSMPSGSDKASKKARAQLINNNPEVSQYLANIALYEALDKGAQFRYVNPANPNATEGQNINASGRAGQTFLKDTSSLGAYDIAKNAAGQYTFMDNGGFLPGYSAASGSGSKSSSSKKPLIPLPPRGKKPPKHSPRKAYIRKETPKLVHIRNTFAAPIRIGHGGGPLKPSGAIKIAH